MKEGSFKAVISTFGVVDRQSDMVLPGAFGRQETVVSQYNHGSWERGVAALPLGIATVYEQGNEAIAEGEFDLEDDAARKTWNMMKYLHSKGRRQEFSYALPDVEAETRTIDGERVRVLKKIRVGEISPVLMGASINTRLLDIKAHQAGAPRWKLATGPVLFGDEGEALFEAERLLRAQGMLTSPADLAQLEQIEKNVEKMGRLVEDLSKYHYTEVGASKVMPAVREAAGMALATFSAWLRLPWPVKIRWFLPEDQEERDYVKKWGVRDWEGFEIDEPVVGMAKQQADHVWIHARRDQVDTVETVAHELVHVADVGQHLSHEEVFLRARQMMQAFFAASPR